MSKSRKRGQSNEILLCCHSAWDENKDGYFKIPDEIFLYLYAPQGAALSAAIPRGIAAGEQIKEGDLIYSRISPITLFNYGYEDKGKNVGDYTERNLHGYPELLVPGEVIPDYLVSPPGNDAIDTKDGTGIEVANIDKDIHLSELLSNEQYKGRICHFGGCSWVKSSFDERNIVRFKDKEKEEKYTVKLTEEEKRLKRAERFGLNKK